MAGSPRSSSRSAARSTPEKAAASAARVARWKPRGHACLCGNLRMAARALSAAYDRHLAACGVQASQLSVLWAIAGRPGDSVREIATLLAMDETTLSRSLRALRGSGWVRMETGTDRRRRMPYLTPAGERVFAEALPHWEAAQAEALRTLGAGSSDVGRQMLQWSRLLS